MTGFAFEAETFLGRVAVRDGADHRDGGDDRAGGRVSFPWTARPAAITAYGIR